MEYWRDYHDGRIDLIELMGIPRRPELIDRIPNPEEFSQTIPGNEPGASITFFGRYIRNQGITEELRHDKFRDNEEVKQFIPAIEAMLVDAEKRGLDVDAHKVTVIVRQGAAKEVNFPNFFGAHVDVHDGGDERIQLIYIVSDYKPTILYEGSFSTDRDEDVEAEKINATPHQPDQYQIAVIDDTIPHEIPPELATDPHHRTFMQVRICTPNPYDQYLSKADML